MSNAWFFEKFELIADLPDAVSRMRELVFSLALRGKLVSQSSSENATHKDDMPNDWVIRRVEQIGRINPRNTAADNIVVGFAPMNVIPTELGQDLIAESRYWGEVKKGYTHFADGDVIVAKITPCFQNGKACVVSGLPSGIGAGTTELHIIRPHVDLVDPKYLLICFKSPQFVEGGIKSFSGTAGQQRVSNEYFRNYPIPLPPLSEQRRIVAKVEELMGICDRLELEQRERESSQRVLVRSSLQRFSEEASVENLGYLFHGSYTVSPSDLRKTILTLAVQGKLVPQDPAEGSAEELVNAISILRQKQSTKANRNSSNRNKVRDVTEQPFDTPVSWTWCRFGEIVIDFRYGTSRKCVASAIGTPVLRIPNIRNGRIDINDLKFTHMPISEFDDLRLRGGNLLLVRSNGSESLVGRSAVVREIDEKFAYAGYLVRARLPTEYVFPEYVNIALSTTLVRDQIEGPIRTTSGVKNINTTELSNLLFPLPPLAEQRRIVAKVEELMSMVDELEEMEKQTRQRSASLLDAVVHRLSALAG